MKWIAAIIADFLRLIMGTPEHDPQTQADVVIAFVLETAEQANKNQGFEGTVYSLAPIVNEGGQYHDLYPQLSPKTRYRVDTLYGSAAFRLHMPAEAHRAFVRASQSPLADEEIWFLRYATAKADDDFADVQVAIRTLS